MSENDARDQQHRRDIADWLLTLLRFAITREPADQAAAIELGRLMDAGRAQPRGAVTFFVRTSHEVCRAIAAVKDVDRVAVLERHVAQIENPRLRGAFRAAVGLDRERDPPPALSSPEASSRAYLWRGLRSGPAGKR
jgi:hypothetical protein